MQIPNGWTWRELFKKSNILLTSDIRQPKCTTENWIYCKLNLLPIHVILKCASLPLLKLVQSLELFWKCEINFYIYKYVKHKRIYDSKNDKRCRVELQVKLYIFLWKSMMTYFAHIKVQKWIWYYGGHC